MQFPVVTDDDPNPEENIVDETAEDELPEEIFFGKTSSITSLPSFYTDEVDDGKSVELSEAERNRVATKLESLPKMSPREIEMALISRGYRGQEFARRAGAVLAYRHMQRLRREFIDHVAEEDFSLRENYLFLGATGSGKTFLTEMLFRDILGVPTIVADVTRYSETGYIGDDVLMLLSELYEAADQDRAWASCGIICLDEFDKLAASRSAARFAGEGTTKDVSGFGVQRGLLNLLSGTSSPFPTDFGYSAFGQKLTMPLHNIMFIACGAFSGLKQVADLAEGSNGASIGFIEKPPIEADDSLVSRIGFELMEDTRAFANYGILPELVGRFSRMVPFQPLSSEVLREILEDNVLKSYRKEFEAEKVELTVEVEVIDLIIESAKRRETGARAVRASLVPHLEEAAFRSFGDGGGAQVRLYVEKGKIEIDVTLLV
ncbi:MAG: AAA family ATPase [Verrucomicrobiales bacterium]|nr:AAA family ATPase [Verrucomicrobiales bacterium]